ncbi:MAG: hypothetical protein Cons2KO_05090 [Congregibacter sp.]
MNKNAKVWDRLAKRYFKAPIKDQSAYEKKLAMTQRYLRPDMSLLELGCGTGGTALRHAPYVKDVLGVDFSSIMLVLAREQAAAVGVRNVAFEQASVEDFNPCGRLFDATLALSLLHLLEDMELGLRRVHDTLKPGGLFISSTACLAEHHGFLKYIRPLGRAVGVFPYFAIFSEDTLISRIEASGFQIEERWKPEAKNAHVVFIIARTSC